MTPEEEFRQKLNAFGLANKTEDLNESLPVSSEEEQAVAGKQLEFPQENYSSNLRAATPEEELSAQNALRFPNASKFVPQEEPAVSSQNPVVPPQEPVAQKQKETPKQESVPSKIQTTSVAPVEKPSAPSKPEEDELGDEALKRAQEQSRNMRLATALGEAAGTFATVAPGGKFDRGFYEEQQKLAEAPVVNIQQRKEAMINKQKLADMLVDNQIKKLALGNAQEASDPNSEVSKTARGFYQMLHPGIEKTEGWNKTSASFLKDFGQHILETEAKIEATKATREAAQAVREEQTKTKKQKSLDERVTKFKDALDPNRMRSGQLGNLKKNSDQLSHVIRLGADPSYGNSLTEAETLELSQGLVRAINGGVGVPTQSQVEHIMPKSWKGTWQDTKSWFLNQPQGREQQEFIQRLLHNATAQKDLYDNQIKLAQLQEVPGYEDIRRDSPELFEAVLNSRGLDSETYDKFKKHAKEGATQGKHPEVDFFNKSSQNFPKKVFKTDPQSGKRISATVSNEAELKEATQEGFQ